MGHHSVTPASRPHITVVIPTANRPQDLERCLRSLTKVSYPSWEILVVDQSDEDRAGDVIKDLRSYLPRLAYRRMLAQGAARARNEALGLIDTGIVAFLDDDCTVEPSWLQDVAAVFERRPKAAVVFGTVKSILHDPQELFIPVYEVREERELRGRLSFLRGGGGSSSCMYLHTARLHGVVPRLLPIDEQTGAGAHFGCEDQDFFYRLLAGGYVVVVTPHVSICHHGGRPYETGAAQRLRWRYTFSTGALHMKILRCGDPIAVLLIAASIWRYLSLINMRNLLRYRRPVHLRFIAAYLAGLCGSFQLAVDRRRYLYVASEPGRYVDVESARRIAQGTTTSLR